MTESNLRELSLYWIFRAISLQSLPMDRIRVYTGGVASCNGYLFKTRDNAYVAVDAPSGFADWIYSKKPDIIITDLLITHQHFDHVEDACRMEHMISENSFRHLKQSMDKKK